MAKTTRENPKFDLILAEAIDEALSICGERAKSAFYTYFEKALNIPKCEIPMRINEFSRALEDLFGEHAHILEILVMKNLHSKIGLVWKWEESNPQDLPNLTFERYVSHAKKHYEDDSMKEEQTGVWIDKCEAREMRR